MRAGFLKAERMQNYEFVDRNAQKNISYIEGVKFPHYTLWIPLC